MFGALFTFSFLDEVGLPYSLSADLWLVCVVVLSLAMYLLVLRPLVKVSMMSIILATIGLSILFENLALLKLSSFPKALPAFSGNERTSGVRWP